ncbi:MAG: flagellar filament capping protein FliD [Pirellulales bacterium]|nr:flagellar filament capping protein FliD [Pirellulales bacterium]
MGKITSNIGLVTGMAIGDTVEALVALSAKRRDLLSERTEDMKAEQIAVTELSALLLAVRYVSDNLGKTKLYDEREASSSNEAVLTTKVTGTPAVGTYQFTPVRSAQNQQWLSTGFVSDTAPQAAGSMTIRYGDDVERATPLELFNGGQGIQRGKIRITDRSGASTQIDLTTVQTVDDILEAINSNTVINVTAVAQGDGFELYDNTGQSVSNLRVQEVAGGTTAASMGWSGLDVAGNHAVGADIIRLYDDLRLDELNDGNGIRFGDLQYAGILNNFHYELRDGTSENASLFPVDVAGRNEEVTVGDVVAAFNEINPDKLRMEISPDGDRLVIRDLTEGEGTFKVESMEGRRTEVAEDLGINVASEDGVIVGRRLLGGAKSVLLSSLNGGKGLGALGTVELTDHSGATDTVNLGNAETLQDVVNALNAADVGILAQINEARNGIQLIDTTGKHASNLIVADADSAETVSKLGIAVDSINTSINSGDLHLQVISYNTRLEDLNGGAGVAKGTFTITDAFGHEDEVDLHGDDIQTVGDVLDKIHRETLVWLAAEINENGDGIWLRDYRNADQPPVVREGDRTTAADLGLLGGAKKITYDGEEAYVIDGSTTEVVQWAEGATLNDIRQKLNDLRIDVSANTFNDGSSRPMRLSIRSNRSGATGGLVIDTSQAGFRLDETVAARDALMVFGDPNMASANVLATSHSNSFTGLVTGLTLNVQQASNTPVTVQVWRSDASVSASAKVFVENYNKFRKYYNELSKYDVENDEGAVLYNDPSARRAIQEIADGLTDRYLGVGSIQSLAQVGITFNQDGTLTYDESKLKSEFAKDPDAVRDFFVGVEPDKKGEEIGIYVGEEVIRVDTAKLNQAYEADPESVIEFFGQVRGRYSLEELGVTFSDGHVNVDQIQLQAKFTGDKRLAEELGYKRTDGVSNRLADIFEGISGLDVSLFAHRYKTLDTKIENNNKRLEEMEAQLDLERLRLYTEFYRSELAIGKLQESMNALYAIIPIGYE